MKKIRSISLVILIAFSCVSCAASEDVSKVNYIDGGEYIYIYGSSTLKDLSDNVGIELSSPSISSGDFIYTGVELLDGGEKYRTAVVVGDVNCDGFVTSEDGELIESYSAYINDVSAVKEGTSIYEDYDGLDYSDCVLAAMDIKAEGWVRGSYSDIIGDIESGAVDIADYMDYRLTGYSENEILVKIAYDYINPDYSVYTAEYFGDGFKDSTVYDLYGAYALCLILTLKNSGIDILEKSIRSLNQREDVMLAEKNYGDNTQGLTEYTPEQHGVKLFNRRSPYTDEFLSFNYDRQYRLLYYSCSVMYGILSEQERSQWLEIYNENDMYVTEPQEPALITFIEYFDVSQEEFDAEIERIKAEREMQGDSFDYYTEAGELPDSDIIYTFDNDVIKEYCKYE